MVLLADPVLLLDDVMDSGWTLTLAARLLRQAGASHGVSVPPSASPARAPPWPSALAGEHAELGEQPVPQLVEGFPAHPAGPGQIDGPVDRNPGIGEDQDPVGQQMASWTSWVTAALRGGGGHRAGHQALHAEAGQGVERGERLVEQQELRLADEGPGQGDPLRLSARKGSGPRVGLGLDPTSRSALEARSRVASRGEPDDDIAPDAHGGDEPRLLVDDGADLGDEDLTAAGDFEPGQYAEQVCSPAARRPQQCDELALGDSDIEVRKDLVAVDDLETSATMAAGWVVGMFIGPPGDGATASCSAQGSGRNVGDDPDERVNEDAHHQFGI